MHETGQVCSLCDKPIQPYYIEYEVEYPEARVQDASIYHRLPIRMAAGVRRRLETRLCVEDGPTIVSSPDGSSAHAC